jgi:diaminopimelate epimerase
MSIAALAGLRFAKMHGAGNDFIIFDQRDLAARPMPDQATIAALCRRQTGIGADGLIIVGSSEDDRLSMLYFNADGGRAEMCGNGARCTVAFAHRRGMIGASGHLETDAGLLSVRIHEPQNIEIELPGCRDHQMDVDLGEGGQDAATVSAHLCNTGVPHLILLVDDPDAVDLNRHGPRLRRHPRLGPDGANVNWVGRDGPSSLWRLRTYERGVEAETLACGTGAAAAAVVLASLDLACPPVAVQTASGDLLHISWDDPARCLFLRGPAVLVFEGEVSGDA